MTSTKKPPDTDFYKCVKVPIKYILKNPDMNLPKINDAVLRIHKITYHTYFFLKLYLLHLYDTTGNIPLIDHEFLNAIMKVICEGSIIKSVVKGGRPPSDKTKTLKTTLRTFYDTHYKPLIPNEQIDYTHLNTVLDYVCDDITTMFENNIKANYVDYVESYVNSYWKKDLLIKKIKKIYKTKRERMEKIRKLTSNLRQIKNDLLNVENDKLTSHKSYHHWILESRKYILPPKSTFEKHSIYYDIQCKPQDYFKSMIYISQFIENDHEFVNSVKRTFNKKEEQIKFLNLFPLRSSIIPSHMKLDTTTLVHLLFTEKNGKKDHYLSKGNLKINEDKIWNFFFRTERTIFKKTNYSFHHMISTDGVSASIIFLLNKYVGKRVPNRKMKHPEKYIDELEDYSHIIEKKIVAMDPGLQDLVYCVDKDDKDANIFRYTQDMRRKEIKTKKYNKLILLWKEEKINDKKVITYESELSHFNKKTLKIEEYKKYIQKKCEINYILTPFYSKYIYKKLKLNIYLNTLRNEQKMINNFKKIFGNPKNVVICTGDFEQKKQMKFKEPTKGKGVRSLFRKAGYNVYLVDEFRTSCKCSKCMNIDGICNKFLIKDNPRPYRKNRILCHGLTKCKICGSLWNRDRNGASNIYKIAYNAIHGLERPLYLKRNNS